MPVVAHHPRVAASPGDDDGERGAVLVIVALLLSVIVLCTAFTVDIGRVSTTRRQLQSVADAVALDAVRQLDGRTAAEITASASWTHALDASRDRNGFPDAPGRDLAAALGHYDALTDTFTAVAGSGVPDAVRIDATDTVDYEFAPGTNVTSRHAVATQESVAGFSIGSSLVSIDSQRSLLLNAIVGDALDVHAVSYQGLAGGTVSLPGLASQLGLDLGTPDSALSANLPLADVVDAEANVLRADGDSARAAILDQVVVDLPPSSPTVTLGQLFDVEPGGETAAEVAHVDALQLLTATALVANGNHFLTVPGLTLSVPGLGTSTLSLQVIEKPQWVFGPVGASAQTSQVRLTLTSEMDTKVVAGLDAALPITVTMDLANATGTISHIACTSPQELGVDVASGAVSSTVDVTGTVTANLGLVNGPVATVDLGLDASGTPITGTADFVLPPDQVGVAKSVGSGSTGLEDASVTSSKITLLPLLGLPVGVNGSTLLSSILGSAVTPALTSIDSLVAGPLEDVLGLSVATADVTPLGVTCSGPQLAG